MAAGCVHHSSEVCSSSSSSSKGIHLPPAGFRTECSHAGVCDNTHSLHLAPTCPCTLSSVRTWGGWRGGAGTRIVIAANKCHICARPAMHSRRGKPVAGHWCVGMHHTRITLPCKQLDRLQASIIPTWCTPTRLACGTELSGLLYHRRTAGRCQLAPSVAKHWE